MFDMSNSTNNQQTSPNFDYINSVNGMINLYQQYNALFQNSLLSNGNILNNFEEIVQNYHFINFLANSLKSQDSVNIDSLTNVFQNNNSSNFVDNNIFPNNEENSISSKIDLPSETEKAKESKTSSKKYLSNKRNKKEYVEEDKSSKQNSVISTSISAKKEKISKEKGKEKKSDKTCRIDEGYSKIYRKKKEEKVNNLIFSEADELLVNLVNNPRKRVKTLANEQPISPEEIIENLRKTYPEYDGVIEDLKKDERHCFMMQNFPHAYEITSFKDYLKIKSRLSQIKNYVVNNMNKFCFLNLKNKILQEECNFKRNWIAESSDTSEKVDKYLSKVEEIWPYTESSFSQEYSLQLLMKNGYDYAKSIKMVEERDTLFISMLKGKF